MTHDPTLPAAVVPGPWSSGPEHLQCMQHIAERGGYEARPCNCGYFADDHMVSCSPEQRVRCHADARKRLELHWREARTREVRNRRKFPGLIYHDADQGFCQWCGGMLVKPDGSRNRRRRWHDACLQDYYVHTRPDEQRAFLVERDGVRCRGCQTPSGAWQRIWTEDDPDAYRARSRWFADLFPPGSGPLTVISWHSALEVDHIVALALTAHLPPDERRRYFGPENLQGLCSTCHKAKTAEDMKLIALARREGRLS